MTTLLSPPWVSLYLLLVYLHFVIGCFTSTAPGEFLPMGRDCSLHLYFLSTSPYYFAPKMLILQYPCSFWAFCAQFPHQCSTNPKRNCVSFVRIFFMIEQNFILSIFISGLMFKHSPIKLIWKLIHFWKSITSGQWFFLVYFQLLS